METKLDWAWLPELLLDSIIKKLIIPADHLRFGCVCKHWLSVAKDQDKYKMIMSSKVPMLMIPTNNSSTEHRSFYNIVEDKIYGVELTMPFNRRCCGSSYGWLAFAMEDLAITLFNPFSGRRIDLPCIPAKKDTIYSPQYYVRKVVLSADPHTNPDDYEAVAIYGGMEELAFIKAGQKSWNLISVRKSMKTRFVASDVIYYHGVICAVNFFNSIVPAKIVLIDGTSKRMTKVAFQRVGYDCKRAYLVESSCGELLVITRFKKFGPEIPTCTLKFQVYSVAVGGGGGEEKQSSKLERLYNLEDDVLFLGDNQSVSILASEFPPGCGCRSNSIYFTDDCIEFDYPKGPSDLGIFNLKDESFQRHYNIPNPLHQTMPPPIWIRSNHQENNCDQKFPSRESFQSSATNWYTF